jgi:hypothetical protein
MASTIYSEILLSIDVLGGNVLRHPFVRHIARTAAEGSSHPQVAPELLLICGNSAIRGCAVFPFNHCHSRRIVPCGGMDTKRCTGSVDTCPFLIVTSCCAQMSRIRSRMPASPFPHSELADISLSIPDATELEYGMRAVSVVRHPSGFIRARAEAVASRRGLEPTQTFALSASDAAQPLSDTALLI